MPQDKSRTNSQTNSRINLMHQCSECLLIHSVIKYNIYLIEISYLIIYWLLKMLSSDRALARKQLDKRLDFLRGSDALRRPPRG